MKYTVICFALISILSCKKNCEEVKTENQLSETHWNLYFKYNPSFTFFAESHLYFKNDKTVTNYRSVDTISGTWNLNNTSVDLNFSNGEILKGILITSDSLSGSSLVAGNNGVWYANKR